MEQLELVDINTITPNFANDRRLVPKRVSDDLIVFHSDIDLDDDQVNELRSLFSSEIKIDKIETSILNEFLSKYYQVSISQNKSIGSYNKKGGIQSLVLEANAIGSSDIHVEHLEKGARIRFRIDGQLIERHHLESQDCTMLINQIKVLARLDIAEKRLPQDGRATLEVSKGEYVNIRVSIVPGLCGEKAVLRILNRDTKKISLDSLGLSDVQKSLMIKATSKKQGLVLVSGPTGSGKTTTLTALIKLLSKPSINVMTLEDPVEYRIEGVTQVNVNASVGLTFAAGLRSFLRQDPDIVMVGEIRDEVTSEICMRASMTGHLVLSSVHTNSALGIIDRLKDLGVPSYMISDTVELLVGQRLVRILCEKCKSEESKNDEFNGHVVFKAVGCSNCYHTGYIGRTAIYEMVAMSDQLRHRINSGGELSPLENDLTKAALNLYKNGLTSREEIKQYLL